MLADALTQKSSPTNTEFVSDTRVARHARLDRRLHRRLRWHFALFVLLGAISSGVPRPSTAAQPGPTPKPCVERPGVAWAVGWNSKPIYHNDTFSKAITFEVEWVGDSASRQRNSSEFTTLESDLGQAFQGAVTAWGSSLLLVRPQLPAPLKSYLIAMLLCDGSRCQYNAPSVVQVRCREDASFVVQVYGKGGTRFPASEENVAAMAQPKGRTILLNTARYQFRYDSHVFKTFVGKRDINLTAVLAHELGHAFGLTHQPRGKPSIMVPDLSDRAALRVPLQLDGGALAAILGRDVHGTAPGYFSPEACLGLRIDLPDETPSAEPIPSPGRRR